MVIMISLIALASYFLVRRVTITDSASAWMTKSILSTILLCIIAVKLRQHLNSLRHIPKAQGSDANALPSSALMVNTSHGYLQAKGQAARWTGLFSEPRAPEVLKLSLNVKNKGLVRYSGLLGGERILVTDPEGLHEVLQEKGYSMEKWKTVKRILEPVLGSGILTADGELHKVNANEQSRPILWLILTFSHRYKRKS